MTRKQFFLLLFLFMVSYNLSSQSKVDNTKPMYGEAEKDERYKKVDDDFRKDALEKFGSVDNAVNDYVQAAWLLFYRNDLETAMKRFNQAWLLNPEFPDAYFGFAALLEMQGNNAEAVRFYALGAEKDKGNRRTIICYQRIAECKEQLGDLKGALAAILKLKTLNPNDVLVYKKAGYLQMALGSYYLALAEYAKAIELDPNDAMTFYHRAHLHQTMNNPVKAIADYTKSVILDPTYVNAYVSRGILEMQLDNCDAGKQDFETAIRLGGQSGELRRLLGVAKLSLDEQEEACKDFRLAKQLGDPIVDELINKYCKQ